MKLSLPDIFFFCLVCFKFVCTSPIHNCTKIVNRKILVILTLFGEDKFKSNNTKMFTIFPIPIFVKYLDPPQQHFKILITQPVININFICSLYFFTLFTKYLLSVVFFWFFFPQALVVVRALVVVSEVFHIQMKRREGLHPGWLLIVWRVV